MNEQSNATKIPANIIVPKKKVDEWDEKFNGMIIDTDNIYSLLSKMQVTQIQMQRKLDSAYRLNHVWAVVIILALLGIFACVGYNTTQFWGWK